MHGNDQVTVICCKYDLSAKQRIKFINRNNFVDKMKDERKKKYAEKPLSSSQKYLDWIGGDCPRAKNKITKFQETDRIGTIGASFDGIQLNHEISH